MDSDGLEAAAQPRCSRCGVVMRHEVGAYECPACGAREAVPFVRHPGEGSGILEFRRRTGAQPS